MTGTQPLSDYLPESLFPAERTRLVAEAAEAGAPREVLDVLEALPGDHLFDNLAEVDEAARPSGSQRLEPDEP